MLQIAGTMHFRYFFSLVVQLNDKLGCASNFKYVPGKPALQYACTKHSATDAIAVVALKFQNFIRQAV